MRLCSRQRQCWFCLCSAKHTGSCSRTGGSWVSLRHVRACGCSERTPAALIVHVKAQRAPRLLASRITCTKPWGEGGSSQPSWILRGEAEAKGSVVSNPGIHADVMHDAIIVHYVHYLLPRELHPLAHIPGLEGSALVPVRASGIYLCLVLIEYRGAGMCSTGNISSNTDSGKWISSFSCSNPFHRLSQRF